MAGEAGMPLVEKFHIWVPAEVLTAYTLKSLLGGGVRC